MSERAMVTLGARAGGRAVLEADGAPEVSPAVAWEVAVGTTGEGFPQADNPQANVSATATVERNRTGSTFRRCFMSVADSAYRKLGATENTQDGITTDRRRPDCGPAVLSLGGG